MAIGRGSDVFNGFEFDHATGRLTRGNAVIPLEFQPSKVLARLLESRGAVVSREELTDVLWGTTTHVKFDDGLNYCIRQVRSALGDDPRSPRFIETIPRRGYRFIAPVATAAPRNADLRLAAAMAATAFILVVVAESRPNNHHETAVWLAHAVHDLIY